VTYRLLLRLLPRHRREAYGAEMAEVFARLCAEARRTRGWVGVLIAGAREAMGMVRFAWRERFGRRPNDLQAGQRPRRPFNADEWRWAWRGIRTRGWRAAFIVMLFGIALAANTVVFSAADTFVLHTLPFERPDQLVVFEDTSRGSSDYTFRDPLLEWRTHTDLFAAIQAHRRGASAYLTSKGITEAVRGQEVTPGLFELLGVMPQAGRPFVSADAAADAPPVVIIGHALARRVFGTPAAAIGERLDMGSRAPTVIGVMPPSFRFPSAVEEIWLPLDLEAVPYNVGVRHVARLQPNVSVEPAAAAVASRLSAVEAALPENSQMFFRMRVRANALALRSLEDVRRHEGAATIVAILAGAAGSLLLIACANVASLEVAGVASRIRTFAVQAALGASRASLIRIGLLEGLLLLAASSIIATVLTFWGVALLAGQLSVEMRDALANSLDPDARVMIFMVGVAAATWLLTSLPAVLRVSRLSVSSSLRNDPRTMPVSRGAAVTRQVLMGAQVCLTVVLLVGALLYIRTYEMRIGLDKGLNADAVATVSVFSPPDVTWSPADLEAEVIARLEAVPGVRALSRTSSLPPSTQSGIGGPLRIAGREGDFGAPKMHFYDIDPEYFDVMGIATVEGTVFSRSSRPEEVVIDERFARRYWPNGSALGARFELGTSSVAGIRTFEVVGVSRQMRQDQVLTDTGEDVFVGYIRLPSTSHPLTYVVKQDGSAPAGRLAQAVRAISPRLIVRTDSVEARYRRLEGDTRLTAAITGSFGALAWIVATGGIFAVMAFLVTGRTREIGIRMALGADQGQVIQLVFGSALRSVAAGTALGLTIAAGTSRYIAAQLYGVSGTDPVTYGFVAALVVIAAAAATWWPARQAARVDPAITLRAE